MVGVGHEGEVRAWPWEPQGVSISCKCWSGVSPRLFGPSKENRG